MALVVPGASRSEIVGPHGGRVRMRVVAGAEKGRANREAERLLAEFFGVSVVLIGGATSRRKTFLLKGINRMAVQGKISEEWG